MTDIPAIWKRIERWLDEHAPEAAKQLLPPATPHAIAKAEAVLGRPLPDDYRASLLCHAGESVAPFGVMGHGLSPLTSALNTRAMMLGFVTDGIFTPDMDDRVRPGPGVRKSWFHEGWLPIAANGSRDMVCLDLAPAEGGTVGQLVHYIGDMQIRLVMAPSTAAWLARRADELERGQIVAMRNPSTGTLHGFRSVDDPDDD